MSLEAKEKSRFGEESWESGSPKIRWEHIVTTHTVYTLTYAHPQSDTHSLGSRDTLLRLWIIDDGADVWWMPKHQDSNFSFYPQLPNRTGCLTACLLLWMTQAPMWRAQAASITVSPNISKSEPRSGRSVSSSSPLIGLEWIRLEVTCCVIGWIWSQWKISPFPFCQFLQCSGM